MAKKQAIVITTIIFAVSIILFTLTYIADRKGQPSGTTEIENNEYLVSLHGEMGIYNVKTQAFELLYEDMYVLQIIGIMNNNEVVFLAEHRTQESGGSETAKSYQGLYKMNLNDKNIVCLAENISKAYLSPDGEKVAYLTFPDNGLEYLNLRTMHRTQVAKPADFGYGNIWSPDNTRLAFVDRNSTEILLFNSISNQYEPDLSPKDKNATYLGWFDRSQLLIKVKEDNVEYMAAYDINTDQISYLFNKDRNIYSAVASQSSIIGLKINPDDTHIWEVVASPKDSPHTVKNLFSIPSDSNLIPTDAEGEKMFVFFRQCEPISDTKVFYQVLDSENHEPQFAGIIDVETYTSLELNKEITSLKVWKDGTLP